MELLAKWRSFRLNNLIFLKNKPSKIENIAKILNETKYISNCHTRILEDILKELKSINKELIKK